MAAALAPQQRDAIVEFSLGRATRETLVAALGVDPVTDREFVPSQLERARATRSSEDIQALLLVAFAFQLSPGWAPTLAALIEEPWHRAHEDLASALQDLRDPSTAQALYNAACARHQYLDFDESHALACKCIWALHDIATPPARALLEQLSASMLAPVRECARARLADLASSGPDHAVPAYRRARDAGVRGR
jgi:hypothetical protein